MKMAAKICSMTSSWPTMTFCNSSCISRRCWLNSCRTSPRLRGLVDKRDPYGYAKSGRLEDESGGKCRSADREILRGILTPNSRGASMQLYNWRAGAATTGAPKVNAKAGVHA